MNKYVGIIVIMLVLLLGWWALKTPATTLGTGPKACTAEAKICPDGTAVGRGGPNCEFAECPIPATTEATTTLAIGESATVNGIRLTVRDLVEDSRCPIDVQCIQAGTVRVSASIDSYKGDLTLKLGEPQVVKNLILMLVSVVPAEKHSKVTVPHGDYRFTFTLVPLEASEPGAGIP